MHTKIKIKSKLHDYLVLFIQRQVELRQELRGDNRLYIIDHKVHKLHHFLSLPKAKTYLFTATEKNKSLHSMEKILAFLAKNKANRQTNVMIIGGGITLETAAMAASLYYRGLKFYFVPTTLLAMSDTCLGGKLSLNFQKNKNSLGLINPPHQVLIYTRFLRTLPQDDIISGLGEILKSYLLKNKDLARLSKKKNTFDDYQELIFQTLKIKKSFVEGDEFDFNQRLFLNLGHTIGHALESYYHFRHPHGICVLMGIKIIFYISKHQGLIREKDYQNLKKLIDLLLNRYSKKIILKNIKFRQLRPYLNKDKKNISHHLKLVLPFRKGTRLGYRLELIQDFNLLENYFNHFIAEEMNQI